MSVEAMTWAFQVPLKPCPKAVLVALASCIDGCGVARVAARELVALTGWSERAVKRALRTLEQHLLIKCCATYSPDGTQLSNRYEVYCV